MEQASYNYGNRCGHVPNSPRLYVRPAFKKKTYDILTDAQKNLAEYYSDPKNWLKNIEESRFDVDKGHSMGQQRTESREAVAAVTGVILDHLDLDTMNIVRYKQGTPKNMSIYDIAEKAGINYDRCWRALMVLQNASYVTSKQAQIKEIALKRVSLTLLHHLGISALRVHLCRGKKHKSLEMKRGETAIQNNPQLKKAMKSLKEALCKPIKTLEQKEEAEKEKQRKYFCKCSRELFLNLEPQIKAGKMSIGDINRILYERGIYHPDLPKEKVFGKT